MHIGLRAAGTVRVCRMDNAINEIIKIEIVNK